MATDRRRPGPVHGTLAVLLSFALPCACTDQREIEDLPPLQGWQCEGQITTILERLYDILFVIDNSPVMAGWQDRLAAAYPTRTAARRREEGVSPAARGRC